MRKNNVVDKRTQEQADNSNMQKNPYDWTTGDKAMPGAQLSYLKPFQKKLTSHSKRILPKRKHPNASRSYSRKPDEVLVRANKPVQINSLQLH